MYCNTILLRCIGDFWSCTQFSDAHALFLQKSGEIVEFKSYIYAINMLDMHDDAINMLDIPSPPRPAKCYYVFDV